jgi:hypothetical protein
LLICGARGNNVWSWDLRSPASAIHIVDEKKLVENMQFSEGGTQ